MSDSAGGEARHTEGAGCLRPNQRNAVSIGSTIVAVAVRVRRTSLAGEARRQCHHLPSQADRRLLTRFYRGPYRSNRSSALNATGRNAGSCVIACPRNSSMACRGSGSYSVMKDDEAASTE